MTHELITVTNNTYINAQSVCDLLRRIAQLGFEVPITLVTDNARYQKCRIVQELAETLDIELYCTWPETALLAKCEDRVCQGTAAEKSAILTDVEYIRLES